MTERPRKTADRRADVTKSSCHRYNTRSLGFVVITGARMLLTFHANTIRVLGTPLWGVRYTLHTAAGRREMYFGPTSAARALQNAGGVTKFAPSHER